MADRFNKSDTMDLTHITKEAQTPQNTPTASAGGEDDYIFIEEDAPSRAAARARRTPGKQSKKPLIITLAVIGVLLVAGVLIFALTRSGDSDVKETAAATQPVAEVAENVIISGINVGGMPYEQAMQALSAAQEKLADEIHMDVICGDKQLTLTKADFNYHFNTEEVLRQAQQNPAGTYAVSLIIDESSYEAIVGKVAAVVDRAPENARVAAFNADKKDMFTFQEAVSGRKLNKDDLSSQLRKLIGSGAVTGTIAAKTDEVKPAYNADYLKQNIQRLSSFTTESTNTANAISNQALSLAACNSSIIEPGSTWSFNNCTGDTNLESRGYLPAGVIIEGRHEIGIGGGICQSSTTIYNAGLLCGMEVVERYEHYYPSSYVDYGLDATIDYGYLDLKLRNPFEYQLFLKCWMDGVILHAEVYGLPAKDFDQIKVTTTDPVYTKTSYTVKASRTYYLSGKEVRTEALLSSTYYFSAPEEPETPTTAPTTPPTQPPTTPPVTPTDPPATEPPATQEPEPEPVEPTVDNPTPEPVDEPPASDATLSGGGA